MFAPTPPPIFFIWGAAAPPPPPGSTPLVENGWAENPCAPHTGGVTGVQDPAVGPLPGGPGGGAPGSSRVFSK